MKNMNTEIISKQKITSVIEARIFELSNLLALKEKALKNAPSGNLRISRSNGSVQYYLRDNQESSRGKYIISANKSLAKQIAQKDYDKKIINAAREEIKILNHSLGKYVNLQKKNHLAESIFSKLNILRQGLINPVLLSDEDYAKQWQEISYEKKLFSEDTLTYTTARGDLVRSKSENIIADTLSRMHVPYRYEYPLELTAERGQKITIHPDFMCLNLKTREEFFWEHFGMMDNPEYSERTVQKLSLYAKNGFFPGKNLIITTETVACPINTKLIEKIVELYFERDIDLKK